MIVVARLAAREEPAGIDILGSDKTGSLTRNHLSLATPFCLPGCGPEGLIRCAALSCRAAACDPIDQAVREVPLAVFGILIGPIRRGSPWWCGATRCCGSWWKTG